MWRAQAIRRRGSIQPTASSIAGNTLHRIVLPRIDSLYLLSGRDLFRLEHLNIDFLHSCPSEQYFRQWLQRYENNRGAMCQSVEALYREYHAARVVRRFLRCITQKHRSLVITGSFAAACYLESHGFEAWRPGEISDRRERVCSSSKKDSHGRDDDSGRHAGSRNHRHAKSFGRYDPHSGGSKSGGYRSFRPLCPCRILPDSPSLLGADAIGT